MQLDLRPEDDPIVGLRRWIGRARAELPRDEADRVALATANREGEPNVRIVLCRAIDERGGLFFYTNYESDKGIELAANPFAALVFHWAKLGRQLRAKGVVVRAPEAISDAYWASRPRLSQLSALCSPQSRPIEGLSELAERRERLEREFEGRPIPRPSHWGGFVLEPREIEFWQEGDARFHERLRFAKRHGAWAAEYLGA